MIPQFWLTQRGDPGWSGSWHSRQPPDHPSRHQPQQDQRQKRPLQRSGQSLLVLAHRRFLVVLRFGWHSAQRFITAITASRLAGTTIGLNPATLTAMSGSFNP